MTADATTSSVSGDGVLDRTHIDWVTVTQADVEALRPLLRSPLQTRRKEMTGFRSSANDGCGAILAWYGREPRSAMLVLPGSALPAWRVDFSDSTWCRSCCSPHCTRIRPCAGHVRPVDSVSDRYVWPWQNFTYRCAKGTTALTVYRGSRTSDVLMRAYDKGADHDRAR
jgi:hypothetical protein